jgi:ArsR family transcriptional regulator
MDMNPSEMFKVLGVETRIRIIELLKSKGPLGVKALAETIDVTPAAISQHLKILKHAGLVRNERKGYWIPYWIDEKALEDCCCKLSELCTCGCKETDVCAERDVGRDSLSSLMKYKEELEKKLQDVQKRISEIRASEG